MARYDNSEKFFNKGLTSIGTSYLPTFKESNSVEGAGFNRTSNS